MNIIVYIIIIILINQVVLYANNILNLESYYKEMIKIDDNLMQKISYSLSKFKIEDEYFLSFNGGKDILASYILLKYYLYCKDYKYDYTNKSSYIKFTNSNYIPKKHKITFLYFTRKTSFEQEIQYVKKLTEKENVQLLMTESDYISGMKFFISFLHINTLIMGTRADDLNNKTYINTISKSLLSESTYPYPYFIRFFPVFNFIYKDIWKLILSSNMEYLCLYDKGFSSIGYINNTLVNPNLIKNGTILPAWVLDDENSERHSRIIHKG